MLTRADKALLLDLNAVGELSPLAVSLRIILEQHFNIHTLTAADYDSEAANFGIDLDKTVRRLNPALIFFLVPSQSTVKGSKIVELISRIPTILVVEGTEPTEVFELLKLGAKDFITSPLKASDVLPRSWRLLNAKDDEGKPAESLTAELGLRQLIGDGPAFLELLRKLPVIAKCDANVLVTGETGTGKELCARAIHYCSVRAGRPFVPVNCGAIPVELVENELFGHERGAFTSASHLQTGLIEEANGGTLFLDEIDCLPLFAQVKLLRFLQEKEYRPLGSPRIKRADVRVIAASNLDLEEAVSAEKFRRDLFYRLNIISLLIPPLRERREDIPLLAQHFLLKYAREFDKQMMKLSGDAVNSLMVHSWPGNVRELEHTIERAVVLSDRAILEAEDLTLSAGRGADPRESLQAAKAKEIARFEKNYIQSLLRICRGNITKAAQVAQKNRRAFWQLIQKHHIDVAQFKSSGS
jgi:two-component system, NtrC family, response regulator GlrR